MNRGRLFALRQTCALALACAMLLGTFATTGRAADPRPHEKNDKAKAASASRINEEYTAKIKEYTTEKFFLTELVDHLPASDKVPSPDKVLGYVVGTPNKLTYTKDMYRYYRELEKATPARAHLHCAGTQRRRQRADAGRRQRRSEPRAARPLQRDHRRSSPTRARSTTRRRKR